MSSETDAMQDQIAATGPSGRQTYLIGRPGRMRMLGIMAAMAAIGGGGFAASGRSAKGGYPLSPEEREKRRAVKGSRAGVLLAKAEAKRERRRIRNAQLTISLSTALPNE